MLFVLPGTKESETVNVTEPFSEVMEDVFSAIADSQWSLSMDGVPRPQQQQCEDLGRRSRDVD